MCIVILFGLSDFRIKKLQVIRTSFFQCNFLLLSVIAEAFQHVRDNVDENDSSVGANETDLVFLKGILDSPAVTQFIKVSVSDWTNYTNEINKWKLEKSMKHQISSETFAHL